MGVLSSGLLPFSFFFQTGKRMGEQGPALNQHHCTQPREAQLFPQVLQDSSERRRQVGWQQKGGRNKLTGPVWSGPLEGQPGPSWLPHTDAPGKGGDDLSG